MSTDEAPDDDGADGFDEVAEARRDFPVCDGSPTRVRRYETCPLSHWFRYVEKVPDPAGPHGRVGTLVHVALEAAGRARIAKPAPPPATAIELVEALGAAMPHVEGLEPADVARAKEILEQLAPIDLAAGGVILLVEHPWTLDVGGVTFGGFWDLLRLLPSGLLEVVDWKTGHPIGKDEAEVDPQVGLYLAAARAWKDRANKDAGEDDNGCGIRCTLDFVAVDSRVRVDWTPELDAFARARARAAHAAWTRGHARPRVSGACHRCFAREKCEPYQAHLKERLVVADGPPQLKDTPLPALLRERKRLKDVATQADERRKDVDEELRYRMREKRVDEFEVAGFKAAIRERRSGSYDVALLPELAAVLGEDPYEVLRKAGRVSADGLKKLTNGNDEATRLAERYRDPKKTTYLEVRTKETA